MSTKAGLNGPGSLSQGRFRCLLVLNGRSRSGDAQTEPILTELRERGVELVDGGPVGPDRLDERLEAAMRVGIDRVLVGGGDGTLNRALPALLRAGVPLGVVPLGTANDFANSLGIPIDPRGAVRIALEGRVVHVDVGEVNGRPFLNVASLGLGTKVTERLSDELKARLGFLGYPHAMLSAYREARPFRARISIDGIDQRRSRCIHIAVGNGRRYGGGAIIAQDATLVDGTLHLFALAPVPIWRLILLAPWLGSGRQRDVANATLVKAARVELETSRTLPISADGEIISQTPAEFRVRPAVLGVAVPSDGLDEAPGLSGT